MAVTGSPALPAKRYNPEQIAQEWFRLLIAVEQLQFRSILPPCTVAELPTGMEDGARGFVTDANATTFASVVAGGGSNKVPVYFDGAWRIG